MLDASGGEAPSRKETTSALDALVEVGCMCGEHIYVTRNSADHKYECHRCGLQFTLVVNRTPDGRIVHAPMFIDASREPELELPEPPEDMMLLCTCGNPLKITRRLYNHRVQCPHCAVRMALVLTFEPTQRRYSIEARQIKAPSLGDTHILERSGV